MTTPNTITEYLAGLASGAIEPEPPFSTPTPPLGEARRPSTPLATPGYTTVCFGRRSSPASPIPDEVG